MGVFASIMDLLHQTFPRPHFWFPNRQFFLRRGVVNPTPNPQPGGTGLIFITLGTGWSSYTPRLWVPILVPFQDMHGIQWDYSLIPVTTRDDDNNNNNNNNNNNMVYLMWAIKVIRCRRITLYRSLLDHSVSLCTCEPLRRVQRSHHFTRLWRTQILESSRGESLVGVRPHWMQKSIFPCDTVPVIPGAYIYMEDSPSSSSCQQPHQLYFSVEPLLYQHLLVLVSRGCYSVQELLSSRLLCKTLKIKIYKTVIMPALLYGCENSLLH